MKKLLIAFMLLAGCAEEAPLMLSVEDACADAVESCQDAAVAVGGCFQPELRTPVICVCAFTAPVTADVSLACMEFYQNLAPRLDQEQYAVCPKLASPPSFCRSAP